MSRLYFDHLVEFTRLEVFVRQVSSSQEEKEELWKIVDDMIHERVMETILEVLPREKHEKFIKKVHKKPHSKSVLRFAKKHNKDVEKKIIEKISQLEEEIIDLFLIDKS